MSQGQRIKFFGSKFSTITGYGTANPISGLITNANPAVVNDVAHAFTSGDTIKITGAVGMTEINNKLFVIAVLTADTYSLLGVDSLNYGVYTSGASAAKATYSESCEITGYTGDSGTTSETESETNCGKAIDFGAPDPGSVSINYNYAPLAFQAGLEAARKSTDQTAIKTVLVNNQGTMIDIGTITQVGRAASSGGLWTGSATLRRVTDRVDVA